MTEQELLADCLIRLNASGLALDRWYSDRQFALVLAAPRLRTAR